MFNLFKLGYSEANHFFQSKLGNVFIFLDLRIADMTVILHVVHSLK